MEHILAFVIASFLGGFFGAGVVIALMPRQIAVRDLEASAELTSAMESLAAELVRNKMRGVRAAVKEATNASPPAPVVGLNGAPFSKDQLRAAFRQARNIK
jgi:hypothetical protein